MRALLFLTLIFATPASRAEGVAASCKGGPVKVRQFTKTEIEEICVRPIQEIVKSENLVIPGSQQRTIRACIALLEQARESSNVLYATSERRKTFNAPAIDTANQATSRGNAVQLALYAHGFVNINLAAIYRSRLKLRMEWANSSRALQSLEQEKAAIATNQRETAAAHEDLRRSGSNAIPRNVPDFAAGIRQMEISEKTLREARECTEQLRDPLDKAFEDWAGAKRGLLAIDLARLAPDDPPGTKEFARSLQEEQQKILDVLANPARRSAAYRVAEACVEKSCDQWASVAAPIG